MEGLDFVEQVVEGVTQVGGQGGLGEDRAGLRHHAASTLGDPDPEFTQLAAHRVDASGSGLEVALADAMQGRDGLLVDGI